jgi:cysteine-rich repeat protein
VINVDDSLGVTGNVTVYGSVWTAGLDLIVGGSAFLVYSSQALLFADQVAGTSCETSTCGDGVRTYDEECDDGNVEAGDCCSATCTLEANDDYTLCVFSGGSPTLLLDAVAPAGGLCGDRLCWLPRTNKGFAYRDPLAPGGLAQIRLKASAGGRAKIRVVGKGEHLGLASLPLPLPIIVQLRGDDGTCWEARYSATGVKQDERRFRGLAEAP